jgi:hypothetical protein
MDSRNRAGWFVGALALAALLPGLVRAADPEPAVAAEWRAHEYLLTYTGFTTMYSCDGLEWKLKLLLKTAGARDDLSVRATCSDPTGFPSRLVTARLKFATLALPGSPPVSGEKVDPSKPVVPAIGAWRAVKLAQRSPRDLEAGDCELVEQFQRELLPYFVTRDVKEHMSCTPHQVSPFGIDLSFDVLAAEPKPAASAPAKP